ncbi:MAG: hypothetical protein ACC628_21335 [Pirellulaceae bacterium]
MWRRNAYLVAVLLVHEAATASLGQQRSPASLVTKSRWARFELVLGRINAVSVLGGQRRCAQQLGATDEVSETLAIHTDAKVPSIRYELIDDSQSLRIEAIDRTKVQIRREPRDGSSLAFVQYIQPKRGAIQLTVQQQGERSCTMEAPSLWHLLLAEPEVCREHLLPILQPLNPDWRLQESVERIEAALCGATPVDTVPREQILRWVAKMDAPDFSARQAADRELRATGVAVLPYLESIDVTRMGREQRSRIQRIREDLSRPSPDVPERIVSWLGHDEALWRSWLGHRNPDRRLAAAQGLAAIQSRSTNAGPQQGAVRRMARAAVRQRPPAR